MTTLTVQLDDEVLQRMRQLAESRHATVDDVVADVLKEASKATPAQPAPEETYEARRQRFAKILEKYSGFDTGGPFTRDEMNER